MYPVWWFDLTLCGWPFREFVGDCRIRLLWRSEEMTKTPREPFGDHVLGYAEQLAAHCDRHLFTVREGV